MALFRNLLTQIGIAERRKDDRMDANGLTVSCATGSVQKKVRIGNISPTGLYLLTEDRWQPGTTIVLTLGEKSIFEESSRSQVNLWTRCVRVDDNGAGLAFTHSHIDRAKWLEAMSRAPSLIGENHPVQVFRFTRALSFLFHISPASEGEILKLVSETLTRERTERVVELALHADDLLESQRDASRTDLEPALVLRILSLAVEVEDAEIREYWARLLAAFSLSGSQDATNLTYMRLLSKLNLLHLRILSAAWLRAIQAGLRPVSSPSPASSPSPSQILSSSPSPTLPSFTSTKASPESDPASFASSPASPSASSPAFSFQTSSPASSSSPNSPASPPASPSAFSSQASSPFSSASSLPGESPSSSDADFCTVKELEAIAGVALVERIEWIISDLHDLGLHGGATKPALCGRMAEVDLSLTPLGVKFCEQCFGQSQPAQSQPVTSQRVPNQSAQSQPVQSQRVSTQTVLGESQNPAPQQQYVPMDNADDPSAGTSQEQSNSLASEAKAMRQYSSVALID